MNEGASVSDGELGQSVTTTIPTTITDNNNQQRTVRGTNVANHGTSVHTVEIDTHTQQCPPANEHGTSHSDYGRRNGDPAVGTVRSNSPGPIRRKRYHDPSTRVPCRLCLSTERDDTLTELLPAGRSRRDERDSDPHQRPCNLQLSTSSSRTVGHRRGPWNAGSLFELQGRNCHVEGCDANDCD
jgi:hypothetical protein